MRTNKRERYNTENKGKDIQKKIEHTLAKVRECQRYRKKNNLLDLT